MHTYPSHNTGHSDYMKKLLAAPTIVHALKVEAALNKRALRLRQAMAAANSGEILTSE
jgi:hypothetical protein